MAILIAAAGTTIAAADEAAVSDSTPNTCDSNSARFHVKQAGKDASEAWALSRWKRGPDQGRADQARGHVSCLMLAKDRKAAKRGIAKQRGQLRMYREYRAVTPYRCQRGRFGTWAIPCSIIECESHFSWSAHNPSGASGPYQLLGWGAPYPARSFRDQLANHRIAHDLYSGGSGRSNWVC